MNDRRRCIFSMFYHQRRRYLSSDARKALSKTVFLPRTAFVVYVKPTERAALDAHLQQIGDIDQIYQWQLHSPDRAQLPRYRYYKFAYMYSYFVDLFYSTDHRMPMAMHMSVMRLTRCLKTLHCDIGCVAVIVSNIDPVGIVTDCQSRCKLKRLQMRH